MYPSRILSWTCAQTGLSEIEAANTLICPFFDYFLLARTLVPHAGVEMFRISSGLTPAGSTNHHMKRSVSKMVELLSEAKDMFSICRNRAPCNS